jgi:hypothetical protein
VITEIKEQSEVVELLLNLLSACMTSPGHKGWNRNGNVLSTQIDGTDGSGTRNRAYAPTKAQAPQSFEPFPYNLGFEYDNGDQVFCTFSLRFLVSQFSIQNIKLLRETVDAIPPVSELQKCSSDVHLQAFLDEVASPLAFPLLRWVLRSSRAHLSLIPAHKQLVEMGTPYQFQIVSTNPEHERTFQKWKQQAKREKQNLSPAQRQQQQVAFGI